MDASQIQRDFDPVTVDDYPLIQRYLSLAQYEESNHNLVNMILWIDSYPLFKCQNENWLLLLGVHEGTLFIYMPLCRPEYFKEAILAAKAIFERYRLPFVLSCFTKEAAQWFADTFPNTCLEENRDSADYVYLCEKLKTFAGKKLQKKRNHLNAFYKEYEGRWQYESFNKDNVAECVEFLKQWHADDPDAFLQAERQGVFRILSLFGQIPYRGGLIRIDGQVKAFAIGSWLSDRMCQENIEKADDEIRGLYQAVMKEWLIHEFDQAEYVNREDDMGHENIRQAKLAYHPEFLIEKYRLCGKENQL